ncbi:unnamed protein product [Rhizophagus irregularis]|uniref:Uncharacterized protein n=1 Tax=Rhizophagus irregularis TaxID=588596 RepID=A0A916E7X2_9GLOM|nr:unnamed protein product [Rhizophagus irregularis]
MEWHPFIHLAICTIMFRIPSIYPFVHLNIHIRNEHFTFTECTRDRNTHLNRRIPCISKITEVISYLETIPEPSEVGNNLPNNLKYGGISSVEELKATIDRLTSQMRAISWQLKNTLMDIKGVSSDITDLSNQQEAAQSKIQDLEETMSQYTASTKKSVQNLQETMSQHTASTKVACRN